MDSHHASNNSGAFDYFGMSNFESEHILATKHSYQQSNHPKPTRPELDHENWVSELATILVG